jgi:hypothetical protein
MSHFRQKHYDVFARAVKAAKQKAPAEVRALLNEKIHPVIVEAAMMGVATLQNELMKIFLADNDKFRSLLFIEACGTGEPDDKVSKS